MRKNRGITLIALIITIIILLILVGVSLNLVIKGNLFGSTKKAVDGTNAKVNKQQSAIDELMNEWDEIEKDACSHNWKEGEILLKPTCTELGKKQKVCENCGNLLEVEIPALGHNYENRVCTRCGEAEQGCTTHTYGDWVIIKSATCIADGSQKRICTVCGIEEVETVLATGVHTYGNWIMTKAATCVASGSKKKTCTVCGIEEVETVLATGVHTYGNWIITKAATCVASGSKKKTCTVCGTEKTETISATGVHTYVSEMQEATCRSEGEYLEKCTGCGNIKNRRVLPRQMHDYVNFYCRWCGTRELS